VPMNSAHWGAADKICSGRVLLSMTTADIGCASATR
jgi:hypothetical protein